MPLSYSTDVAARCELINSDRWSDSFAEWNAQRRTQVSGLRKYEVIRRRLSHPEFRNMSHASHDTICSVAPTSSHNLAHLYLGGQRIFYPKCGFI